MCSWRENLVATIRKCGVCSIPGTPPNCPGSRKVLVAVREWIGPYSAHQFRQVRHRADARHLRAGFGKPASHVELSRPGAGDKGLQCRDVPRPQGHVALLFRAQTFLVPIGSPPPSPPRTPPAPPRAPPRRGGAPGVLSPPAP